MQIIAPQCINSSSAIETVELPRYIKFHLDDARIRQLSPRTIQERGIYLGKLVWFLKLRDYPMCDTAPLRDFFGDKRGLIEAVSRRKLLPQSLQNEFSLMSSDGHSFIFRGELLASSNRVFRFLTA